MAKATLDSHGRLAIPKEIREQYGERYHIVELHRIARRMPRGRANRVAICWIREIFDFP